MIPGLPEVEAYRDRILAGIDAEATVWRQSKRQNDARRRVGRDVEGLRQHARDGRLCAWEQYNEQAGENDQTNWPCPDALRYWTDLCEVGVLYGQPWEVQTRPEPCDGRCDDRRQVCVLWHGEVQP